MKQLLFLILIISASKLHAQVNNDTMYYDAIKNIVAPKNATMIYVFYLSQEKDSCVPLKIFSLSENFLAREALVVNSTRRKDMVYNGPAKYYYNNGKVKQEATFKFDKREGEVKEYYKEGGLKAVSNWKNDNLHGNYETFYNDGKISLRGKFDEGKNVDSFKNYYKTGELKSYNIFNRAGEKDYIYTYYKNGTLKREEIWRQGEMKKGKVFDEKGKEIKYFDYYVDAEFKGGNEKLVKYFTNNLKTPKKALEAGKSGATKVTFVIDEDGNIKDVEVVETSDHMFDEESKRVVRGMPKWRPRIVDGEAEEAEFTIPLRFVINN